MAKTDLGPGVVAWAALEPIKGREQGGHRPVLVLSGADYLDVVTSLVIVIPVTTVERGWPNHVALRGKTGLTERSWAMTEQIRTISRGRITRVSGKVAASCMAAVRLWVSDFLDLDPPRTSR